MARKAPPKQPASSAKSKPASKGNPFGGKQAPPFVKKGGKAKKGK